MKHAGEEALDRLEPVLAKVRGVAGLKEKSRGVFYRGGAAVLHFHEDPAGLFADLKGPRGWKRMRVSTAKEAAAFVAAFRRGQA